MPETQQTQTSSLHAGVTQRDIIVIGASAGGLAALTSLCRDLPADLPASVFIVWHISPVSPGILPEVLAQAGQLPAKFAEDGEAIRPGQIYIAPPDHHMLLGRDGIRLNRDAREN